MTLRYFIFAPVGFVLWAVNIGLLHLTLRLTKHRRSLGVAIVNFAPRGTSFEAALAKVSEALALIDGYDPRRFRRITRDVKYVIVARTRVSTVAEYWHSLRACMLDIDFVTGNSPGVIAMLIAHEATHARLRRIPVRSARHRVERCCVHQEIAFAERLPEPARAALVGWAQTKQVDEAFWSESSVRERANQRLIGTGMPGWIVRVFGK